jgi:hypothetical protein
VVCADAGRAAPPDSSGEAPAVVTLAWLPAGTGVEQLARAGLSPGLMSAGLGSVPAAQTYLDVGQGNRVFDSLYDGRLPELRARADRIEGWPAAVSRAESAPADIVPGLLRSSLRRAGFQTAAAPGLGSPALVAAGTAGRLARSTENGSLEVLSMSPRRLRGRAAGLRGDDLLIAIERPPPASDRALAIGIAGRGFSGNLTSDSTRLAGYVLSTDVAPTILHRVGVGVPAEMSGEPIRTSGEVDPGAVESLGGRMAAVPERRGPVIGLGLLVWLLALALLSAATRGRAARFGVRLAGLSVVYLPLVLLLGAALEPSRGVEQLLAIAGAPLLGLVTLRALGGYRALAVASALTVLAYAIDAIAGSELTALSLLGPNPVLGVRFYGIGNELEAMFAVLVVAGTGAALTAFAPRQGASHRATVFLAVGLSLGLVFAAGRFGADVGAAIVLPFGSAVAAYLVAAPRRRRALLVAAAPLAAVGALALADLLSGANAHLTRSVFEAGGLGDLADVAQRRLQLSAHSFVRPVVLAFMPLVLAGAALAIAGRNRLAAWLRGLPAMRAGLWGALAATLVGTLANDSGAIVLEIGAVYLLVFTGFAWAEGRIAGAARSID